MPHRSTLRAALLALALLPLPAAAQGALSTQGLGYPPGQLATRAAATGGGLAEFDPVTPLNPAALDANIRSALYVQYEPEFRRVTTDGGSARTTTSRFPLIGGSLRVGDRIALAATASTFLDRTWRTTLDTTRIIDGEEVDTKESFSSLGSITDLRLGASYTVGPALRVGLGVHGFTGENRLRVTGSFGDSVELNLQDDVIGFGGMAVSAGAMLRLGSTLSVAGSARKGGALRARDGDDVIASARVPDRYGAGVRYTGIAGTTLAANLEWTGWTALGDLVSARSHVFDGFDAGVGADVAGPRFGSRIITMRGGLRWRTLPFGLADTEVKELGLSVGAGVPLARERSSLDLGLLHARRSAGGEATERAWMVSVGVSVRP